MRDGRRWIGLAILLVLGCAAPPRKPPDRATTTRSSPPEAPGAGSFRPDLDRREAELRDRLLAHPDDAADLMALADVYAAQGRWTAARQALEATIARHPHNARARERLARAYFEVGNDGAALRHAELAARLDPNCGDALAIKGVVLARRGAQGESLAALERGWRTQPPSLLAGRELARLAIAQRDDAAALRQLQACLAYYPKDIETRRLHAELLARNDQTQNAIREWETLVRRGEAGADGYFQLARLYHQTGDRRRAWENYRAGQRLDANAAAAPKLFERLSEAPTRPRIDHEYPPLTPSSRLAVPLAPARGVGSGIPLTGQTGETAQSRRSD